MKLFVANTTKHIQEFLYRIPEFNRVFPQTIQPGAQVQIYQDAPNDVLEYIINQHTDTPKPFCVSVEEAARNHGFIGLIYSFDKPVPLVKIKRQFEANDEALEEQGGEQRKEAAAALSQTTDQQASTMGASVNSLEMSVVEQTPKGGQNNDKGINEVVSVVKPGSKASKPGKGGKGGNRGNRS